MRMLERLRRRPHADAGDRGPADAGAPGEGSLPIANYDGIDVKQLKRSLSVLAQVDLAVIERYERSHQARPVVLNRLRWLRGSEPMPGYDALDSEAIVAALSGADAGTLKEVRGYERRHRDRGEVRAEVERVLPTAPLSAGQGRAREEQARLVRAGFEGRGTTGGSPP